jgi:hypothetical protein
MVVFCKADDPVKSEKHVEPISLSEDNHPGVQKLNAHDCDLGLSHAKVEPLIVLRSCNLQ